ncbi:ModD protein [Hydrogenophaga flava]|uniref:ModD protein n=1 Tax=Hydrogenophaga flava TaxID=65657 RepID=UPI0008270802|nr:ModD protein [Hydrogenophaga flava]
MPTLGDEELYRLLQDDAPCGDLTTESLVIGTAAARLDCSARGAMVVCGVEEAARLFELAGARTIWRVDSGSALDAGERLLVAEGTAAQLHRAWKTAQTLVEWASGISTVAAAIVAQAGGVAVACTRKNVPGTKALSVKAVKAGGAVMHRLGLSETLLVFAEHRLFLDEAPVLTVARLHRNQPEKKIVVEVSDVAEAQLWAQAGADVLQLEKFSPAALGECRAAIGALPDRPLLAAAGGVRADNAAAYVAAGADLLVTSAPFTAPPRDVQVDFIRR